MTNSINTQSIEDVRTYLFGLTIECPLGNNPADCQLHVIRLLPLKERFEWVDSLSDAEVIKYYDAHLICLAQKEKQLN